MLTPNTCSKVLTMNLIMDVYFIAAILVGMGLANGFYIGQTGLAAKKDHSSLGIFNGKKAKITKFPYMAAVLQSGTLFGSGVIIDQEWILTTAFNVIMVPLSDLHFRVGSNKYDDGGQELIAQEVIVHENYTGSWDYDIALVNVASMQYGKKVKPIALGTSDLVAGTTATIAGWGSTSADDPAKPSEILLTAHMTVLDWNTCNETYTPYLTTRMMCTSESETAPSLYDFGDPLVVKNTLYGLFAGAGAFLPPGHYPIVYTDIPPLVEWVKSKTSPSKSN